ncbi:restriction system modified-DNA reader domain-containing protein [Cellulomonas sp. P5_E12]
MDDGDLSARNGYLFEGRRVRMTDLLDARILEPDTELEFVRPRAGRSYYAILRADGRIELENGRAYNAPSRAAVAAVGSGSFDGWFAWRVKETGEFLADAREQLLDRAAADAKARLGGAALDTTTHHDFLKDARARARAGDPVSPSVEELLHIWGATSRSELVVERISTDLENYGLTTDPNFFKVSLDTPVKLIEIVAEDPLAADVVDVDVNTSMEIGDFDGPVREEVGLTLGHLPSSNVGVKGIHPQASIDEAITRMLIDDFSQLPVMQKKDDRSVRHAVTWQSIARAWHIDKSAELSDAFVVAQAYRFDTELIDVLDVLQKQGFVLVQDATNVITGIVTAADVVGAYGDLASPFFLIGELDRLLRRLVSDSFSLDQVNAACAAGGRKRHESFTNLSFGDYQSILSANENWSSLGWPLERAVAALRVASS